MWTLAIKTLIADRGKLLAALVGVIFSVVLVNVQGGLFFGLIRKASLLVDRSDADIWVGHKKMNNVDFPQNVPRRLVQRIRSLDGVKRAEPYLVGHSVMTLPDGGFEYVLVVGCEAASLRRDAPSTLGADQEEILRPDGILVDVYDSAKIGNPQLGDIREIGHRRARVVGFTDGVLGFLVTPYVFTTIDRAAEYLGRSSNDASYFLVHVADGASPQEVCRQIRERLPDLEAYTRDQYAAISIAYWMQRTGLGISFGAATALGLVVGLIIVGQTLYASVLDRLTDFGTLKAIGAYERQVQSVILHQRWASWLSARCSGCCACWPCKRRSAHPAPINIPWFVSLGSCLVVTVVCLVSSLLPYLRIRSIDPATVLQS